MSPGGMNRATKRPVAVLLLKTKSQPNDSYEELFNTASGSPLPQHCFRAHFVPVLEHKRNDTTLPELVELLRSGQLEEKYGGMVFTSQRAVESWMVVVKQVEDETEDPLQRRTRHREDDPFRDMLSLIPFPLYTVGPATSRALRSMTDQPATTGMRSAFRQLSPSVHGEQTGNGANLAQFILKHYNQLQAQKFFDYYEAPRLPFIPLLGMSSQNYGRKRLERDDDRLRKKPLLFLVGETRRDVIPTTLMSDSLSESERIEVHEVEVYSTVVLASFGQDLEEVNRQLDAELERGGISHVRVVVVFSPQGSEVLLRQIGVLDAQGKAMDRTRRKQAGKVDFIIAAIGPTTRSYLEKTYGLTADICASKPSPEGLKSSIDEFIAQEYPDLS